MQTQLHPKSKALMYTWLQQMLTNSQSPIWTTTRFKESANALKLDMSTQKYLAPNGVVDLIDLFFDESARQLNRRNISRESGTTLAVRDAVLEWLQILAPNKYAVQDAFARALILIDGPQPVQRLYHIADTIWQLAAEPVGDHNDTSRRVLLSFALVQILGDWLKSDTNDQHHVEEYVERRLRSVSSTGRMVGNAIKRFKP